MTRLLVAAAVAMLCQAQPPAFEAASVKLNRSGGGELWHREPGRLALANMTLRDLVLYAYDVHNYQISGGPVWFDSDRWDIAATAGREISEDERRRMLQTLLKDRFQMTIRHETKELPVYALVVGKSGSKLKANTDGVPEGIEMDVNEKGFSQLIGQNVPMSTIVKILFGPTGRIVIDRTGIGGSFDFKLEWMPDSSHMPLINGAKPPEGSAEGASIFTAVQEQLGLKLESTKGPVEILVIDRAEKVTEN
jgi:uncharacterized protein (TIGR03435 family)